jgi:hypothetical protein
MAASAVRLAELGMATELASEVAAQIDDNLPVTPGSIEDADIAANAAIATSKLADGTEIAALVADATPLAALATVETELTALAGSDLVTAIGTPAAYSEVAEDIAAVLVAAGLMQPDEP